MRLAVLAEATTHSYDSARKGNIFWYLETFFTHQPDAYDEAGLRYYIPKEQYQIFIDDKEVDAVELDTWDGHQYTKRPFAITVWVRTNSSKHSNKLSRNYLYDFGEHVEIRETRKVELPKWIGSRG